jgi:hypothetical protein
MLIERAEMEKVENGIGTLKITGYVRGAPFNVNKLVHIQQWGDFQLEKIVSVKDPRTLREQKVRGLSEIKIYSLLSAQSGH